ncbi:MAG: TCP-1/cpn60 chaperonin family protein [Chloroflexota bacterium]
MNRPQVVGQPTTSQHFKTGINQIADLLAPTLGPTGGHVASQRDSGMKVELLDDAATIVRRILSIGQPQDDIGAMVMRNLIWRVSQRAGDGGATAAVLAREFFNQGMKLVAAGVNSVRLERGVEQGIKIAIQALKDQAHSVHTEDELSAVAKTITKEGDLSLVLGEMSYLLGSDPRVIVEKYVAPYLEREYINGAHYKAKISSMYFYTDAQRKRAVITDLAVALVNERLERQEQVVPLLEGAIAQGKKGLLLIVKDVVNDALGLLVSNHQLDKEKKKLDILSVKLSEIGDEMRWGWMDLATLTGATILGPEYDRTGAQAVTSDLGEAQRAEYASEGIVLVAPRESRNAIQQEVANLRTLVEETPLDDEERPKYVKRLSTLTGGIGRLKIGASSKLHREMLYQHSQRAFNVLSAAQRGGIVPGGGAGLMYCVPALEAAVRANGASEEILMGIRLVSDVLSAPMRQIVKNAGIHEPAVIVDRVLTAGTPATYNALTGEVGNAFDLGVLDVVDVLATSLSTAASGAMMALSTDAIVYHKKPEQSLQP